MLQLIPVQGVKSPIVINGVPAAQSINIESVFTDFIFQLFNEGIFPVRLVEFGSLHGGFTIFLNELFNKRHGFGAKIYSFDKYKNIDERCITYDKVDNALFVEKYFNI